jgi:hypothetical protein
LCRDKPEVEQVGKADMPDWLERYFVFASYQAASTLTLSPKAKDGSDVVGRLIALTFRWQIPEGSEHAPDFLVPTSVIREAAIDRARRSRLKVAPVAPLPRAQSLATLSHYLALPAVLAARGGDTYEARFRAALQSGGTGKLEQKYPGVIDAVAKAQRTSIVNDLLAFEDEVKAVTTADLAKLSDAQLAGLAAAKQPITAKMEATVGDPLRISASEVLETADAKRVEDIHARYLDMLEAQPGGPAAIDAFTTLSDKISTLLAKRREQFGCQARVPVRKALVAFLTARGASANARLIDLSMKADEVAKPCPS